MNVSLIYPLTQIDTSKSYELGSTTITKDGKEYIYLAGCGTTIAGNFVTYDYAYATTLLESNGIGPVALTIGAVDSTSKYGWYQIKGPGTAYAYGTTTAKTALYSAGTAGYVCSYVVTGDLIAGGFASTTGTSWGTPFTVYLNYPFCTDTLS